ncbi:hypothetical protein HF520_06015 [Romboutsia sp. CE17]|uniref:hypothetical protein n=1 Tax=Romboutsia sp. CE17 TaxID=2724150 RepID=UPI001442BFB1|nr:hypothetical protein [Romboutsia sp. CE17]QJA08523.1 hypothetical protein HF520_06015 [Romboutsia sp. CE17]
MKIDYEILNNLLKNNKGIKLIYRENTNILDIFISNTLISTLELESNNIESHSEEIYNAIVNLKNINLYIPKIYIKEN